MLPSAHVASSYLISQAPRLFGQSLTTPEVLIVITAGNIIDVDFIVANLLRIKEKDHHNLITHTPIFILGAWTFDFILFSNMLSNLVWFLILIVAMFHLVLDSSLYWFYKWGKQKISKYPQINWLYPLTPFIKKTNEMPNKSFLFFLKNYFNQARFSVFVEVLLVMTASLYFLLTSPLLQKLF